MDEEKKQVNTQMDADLYRLLEKMAEDDADGNISFFVRKLIRQEYARRQQPQLPLPASKKLPTNISTNKKTIKRQTSVGAAV